MPILALLFLLTISLSAQPAHATGFDIADQTSCEAVGGTWDRFFCTVSSLAISSGETGTLEAGVVLIVTHDLSISPTGSLNNFGAFDNDPSSTITNYGTITNSRSIENFGNFTNYGTITNSGIITNEIISYTLSHGIIANLGAIDNSGTIINFGGNRFATNATIDNSGSITNSGTIDNRGGFISNSGPITNTGTITNSVFTITNSIFNFGPIDNSGVIDNRGEIINVGIVTNDLNGSITNSGTITNAHSIDNSGFITNELGASIINNIAGIINNSFVINNYGAIDNFGIINNSYVISNYPPGTITNSGTINNECGGITNDIEGFPVQWFPCAPTITSTGAFSTSTPTIAGTGGGFLTITLYDDSVVVGTVVSSSLGTWSLTTSPLSTGSHTLTATGTNDQGHTSPPSDAVTITIVLGTTTSVTCSPNPIVPNQVLTCTAAVKDTDSAAAFPTGTVSFTFDASPDGSCQLPESGAPATCSVSSPAAPGSEGTHTIGATYDGDENHLGSSDRTVVTVTGRSTRTSVSCSPSPVVVNQPTTCTAAVADSDVETVIPLDRGTVTFTSAGLGTFSDGGTCILVGGSCSLTYTPSSGSASPPVHSISTSYAGDVDHLGSVSGGTDNFDLTVNTRSTSTSVTCDPNPVDVFQASFCNATVGDTDGGLAITPTGTVLFSFDGHALSSCHLSTGTCAVSIALGGGSTGSHSISMDYVGDLDHYGSSGSTVLTVDKRPTTTAVTCSDVVVNEAIMCDATVRDTGAGSGIPGVIIPKTPFGSVSIMIEGVGSSSCTLVNDSTSSGIGSCSVSLTPGSGSAGSHLVTATYSPAEEAHLASSGTNTMTVTKRSTSTSVSCSRIIGPLFSCTVTVSDASLGTPLTPTGTVAWSSGGVGVFSSPTCTLRGSGSTASCTIFWAGPGRPVTVTIKTTYQGNVDHIESSGSATIAVR